MASMKENSIEVDYLAPKSWGALNEILLALIDRSAIHPKDKASRPQTRNGIPVIGKCWRHLETYMGVGGLLNTSFNLHGYPIGCTPEQASWTLENSKLDALALGNYLATKEWLSRYLLKRNIVEALVL